MAGTQPPEGAGLLDFEAGSLTDYHLRVLADQ